MMPKSTATSRPASSRNRLPGCMSAWKKPSRSAWRRKLWITLRPRSGRSTCDCSSRAWSFSAMPSIHSIVSTLWVVRSQSTVGTRKSGSSRGVLRHLGHRGRFQPQIHLHRDRARHRVDDFDQPQPARFRRMRFGVVRDKEEIGEVAAETRGDVGPQHLDRDRFAHAVALDLAAMHLRDRGGGDRRPEARKGLRHRAFQRCRDHGLGFALRERRQPVLQAFQVARHRDADHVGPGREKLSELEVGRPEPRQRARQPRTGFGAGPLDHPRQPQRELAGRRHQARDRRRRTRLRARTRKPARTSRAMWVVAEITNASPNAAPRCRRRGLSHFTREKPAARIISAKALGLGNFRIDSTRYW